MKPWAGTQFAKEYEMLAAGINRERAEVERLRADNARLTRQAVAAGDLRSAARSYHAARRLTAIRPTEETKDAMELAHVGLLRAVHRYAEATAPDPDGVQPCCGVGARCVASVSEGATVKMEDIESWSERYATMVRGSASLINVGDEKAAILMMAPTIYEVAADAVKLMPPLLEEREKALGAIFLLLEDEPEDHDHFGCDRVGAECSWCYARKVYEEARR